MLKQLPLRYQRVDSASGEISCALSVESPGSSPLECVNESVNAVVSC